ncbi:MAG TPA: phytanoyl-CoA dioxygenase family protein [Polyangia bacterium]|nr:phytanoyl-CoA dioxygenase family protein [Polyangia bacterium]
MGLKTLLSARAGAGGSGAANRSAEKLIAKIDRLTAKNRKRPDSERERELIQLRHQAFSGLADQPPAEPVIPSGGRQFELDQGMPKLNPDELSADPVGAAIAKYGCAYVPGLVSEDRVERLKSDIDNAFDAREHANGGDPTPWYDPFKPESNYSIGGLHTLESGRKWVGSGGAMWTADSPRTMFEVLDVFADLGLRGLVSEYLGEQPAISMNKFVLRRAEPTGAGGADWHQDGAFLGADIRSLNVWLSLSHCGETAPGMDIIPRRLDGIVPPGGEGANFKWSVGQPDAERVAGDAGIVRPHFKPGDVLLFDHVFLHRTASEPDMTDRRYAIETWFFAPSNYPKGQVPLLL